MNDVYMTILKVVVSICAALITVYVVPYIKALKDNERYSALADIVEVAVHAAEQTIKAGGAAKKSEVLQFVGRWLDEKGVKVTQDELDQLIEAAVFAMNRAKEAE